jgi:predicted nucleic acid-binding Zn ribbon protein
MDCPNCGTYNPKDREKCWRCDEPLPTPEPRERRDPQKRAQTWLYVIIAIFAVITVLQMCGLQMPGVGPAEPTGSLPALPPVASLQMLVWTLL